MAKSGVQGAVYTPRPRPLSKREARRIATRLAYEAVQQTLQIGNSEGATYEDQLLIDNALDAIAQRLYERSVDLRSHNS